VILVGPTGSVRRIYSVPRPEDQQVVDGYLEGNYALLDVDHLPRNANGVLPTVRAIVLIDLRDNSAKVLDRTTDQQAAAGGRTIRRAVLWAGHVYWDVSPRFAGPHPVIRDYDIATGKTSDAGRTSFGSGPEVTAEGVIWSEVPTDAPAVARTLPQAVVTDRTASRSVLQTDGRAYAWATADRRIAWWDPDSAGVVVFRMPRGVAADVIGVAGRYVLFDDQAASNMVAGIEVLDTRSGVTAQLTDIQPFVLSGAGVVVAYRFTGAFKASRFSVVRFDTAALPELRC
jgi:hypothetical protein